MNWADHFNTYQDACDFYGCDGPRQLAAEDAYWAEIEAIEVQDAMEARGGPLPAPVKDWWDAATEEVPF